MLCFKVQIYLQTLTDKSKQPNNTTLRTHKPITQSLLFQPSIEPLKNVISEVMNPPTNTSSIPMFIQPSIPNISPTYGCLKGGTMPTYRTIMNQTRKQPPIHNNNVQNGMMVTGGSNEDQHKMVERKMIESMKRINEMKETSIKLQQLKHNSRPKKMKRKKTLRRTYKIGRSKIAPKVSVLVSNKTIRNNISTKSQLIKQTPIEEVKRFLVKRGLIKVGSITPNDVLRKMYESTIMICGEVYNHNPENLMYNFFNDKQ